MTIKPDIQSTINSSLEAYSSIISINDTTSTKIANAQIKTDGRPNRIFFSVNNPDRKNSIFIKLQAASIDNNKIGIIVGPKGYWEMPIDNIYKGEISVISDNDSFDIYVTEY